MITSTQAQELGYLLDPCFQIVNTAGKPVTNGYIEIYYHGTRTKYYAFSDWNGTLHPFQIPLDSLGSNIVLADPANSYDVYVYNAFGSLIMSRYNVTPGKGGGSSGGLPTQHEAEHWMGQYGATQPLEGNERGQTLALPHRPDYQGDFIDHIDWGYINGDEVNQYPKYMYLKPGLYLVNCVIRFQQQQGTEVNRLDETLVYTGNGNANEDVAWQLDETGPLSNGNRHCLKLTFIRKVLDEGETSTVDCNNILYFAPGPCVNWSDAYIQTLQIVKLNSISGEGGQTYVPGDYISIVGNVISVTGVLPESATGDFVKYDEYNTEIQNIHNEIDNLEITVQNATSQIVEQTTEIVTAVVEEVAPPMVTSIIERELAGVTGDFATRDELATATGDLQNQIDNIPAGVQSDWEENDPEDPAYIQHKPDLDIYATHDELQSATSEIINIIETVTGNVPTGAVTHEELENATSVLQNEIESVTSQIPTDVVTHEELANVTSQIPTDVVTHQELANVTAQIPTDVVTHPELENATSVLQNEIDNIPAQVQSDWTQTATGEPDYIKHKPDVIPLVPGQNISIDEVNGEIVISAAGGGGSVTGDYVERNELENVTAQLESEIETVTSMIPAAQVQSDWTQTATGDPSYIKHKPDTLPLVEGENISINEVNGEIVISAAGGVTGDFVETSELESVTADIQAEIENVTAQIPTELPVVGGTGIGITETETEITIAVTGDYVTSAELATATAAVEADIPVVTSFATKAEVTSAINTVTGMIPDLEDLNTAGITDIQVVNALPASPVSTVLYLVRE